MKPKYYHPYGMLTTFCAILDRPLAESDVRVLSARKIDEFLLDACVPTDKAKQKISAKDMLDGGPEERSTPDFDTCVMLLSNYAGGLAVCRDSSQELKVRYSQFRFLLEEKDVYKYRAVNSVFEGLCKLDKRLLDLLRRVYQLRMYLASWRKENGLDETGKALRYVRCQLLLDSSDRLDLTKPGDTEDGEEVDKGRQDLMIYARRLENLPWLCWWRRSAEVDMLATDLTKVSKLPDLRMWVKTQRKKVGACGYARNRRLRASPVGRRS